MLTPKNNIAVFKEREARGMVADRRGGLKMERLDQRILRGLGSFR